MIGRSRMSRCLLSSLTNCAPATSDRSITMQSNDCAASAARASRSLPTAVQTMPSPLSISTKCVRQCSSASTISSVLIARLMKSSAWPSVAFSSSLLTGFVRYDSAPSRRPRSRSSCTEMMCTGMCRMSGSFFSRSSTVQPSTSLSNRSSVIASGLYCRASPSASAPRCATTAL